MCNWISFAFGRDNKSEVHGTGKHIKDSRGRSHCEHLVCWLWFVDCCGCDTSRVSVYHSLINCLRGIQVVISQCQVFRHKCRYRNLQCTKNSPKCWLRNRWDILLISCAMTPIPRKLEVSDRLENGLNLQITPISWTLQIPIKSTLVRQRTFFSLEESTMLIYAVNVFQWSQVLGTDEDRDDYTVERRDLDCDSGPSVQPPLYDKFAINVVRVDVAKVPS